MGSLLRDVFICPLYIMLSIRPYQLETPFLDLHLHSSSWIKRRYAAKHLSPETSNSRSPPSLPQSLLFGPYLTTDVQVAIVVWGTNTLRIRDVVFSPYLDVLANIYCHGQWSARIDTASPTPCYGVYRVRNNVFHIAFARLPCYLDVSIILSIKVQHLFL